MTENKEKIEFYETKANHSFVEFIKYMETLILTGKPDASELLRIKELRELKRNTYGGTE